MAKSERTFAQVIFYVLITKILLTVPLHYFEVHTGNIHTEDKCGLFMVNI